MVRKDVIRKMPNNTDVKFRIKAHWLPKKNWMISCGITHLDGTKETFIFLNAIRLHVSLGFMT